MRNVRPFYSLGLFAVAALFACEPVDDGAATRAQGWDGTLSTVIQPGPREVFTDTDETITVPTGCDKTIEDAHNILKTYCAGCHAIGPASYGVAPTFDFVMDDDRLKTETWKRMGQAEALRFLIPGDAANSVIYERAVLKQDMPPVQADPQQPFYPRVTYSEASVLEEWITNCFQGGSVAAPTTGAGGGG